MPLHGYADWQSSPQWRSPILVNNAALSLGTVLTTVTTLVVTNYAYLQVVATPTGNNAKLEFTFQDSTGAFQYGQWGCTIRHGDTGVYNVPVAGDQVVIQAQRAAGAAATLDLGIAAANVPYQLSGQDAGILLSQITGTFVPGAAMTQVFSGYQGLAWYSVDASGSNMICRLRCYSLDGVTVIGKTLAQQINLDEFSTQVYVPPVICDVQVVNTGTNNQTFTLDLVAQQWAGH